MAMEQIAKWSDEMEQILRLFPVHIRNVLQQAQVFPRLAPKLEEIRVRVNQPIELITADGAYFLKDDTLVKVPDRQCLSAVSYTHLDVYKRQALFVLWKDRIYESNIIYRRRCPWQSGRAGRIRRGAAVY